MRAADRTFTVAHSYRRWMQKVVADYLSDPPLADPIRDARFPRLSGLPSRITQRWPAADLERLLAPEGLRDLPIDHHVKPGPLAGGRIAALGRLDEFLGRRLSSYEEDRNQPDVEGSTGLSPYLHFGQISAHEIVSRILDAEDWDPSRLGRPLGKNHGFWGTQPSAEALLDQLLTWRELGFNMCSRELNYDRYESLPNWARQTLAKHARDPRERVYTLEQFAAAETHDHLWNAAQRQLNRDGVMHNYLRMLWGKKILEWTRSPEQALEIMIELNNRYALDGRDPNSYSGIFWVLGRYDRAWGPERPIFGLIRYMSSENTQKKVRVRQYLERYGADADSRLFPR
jgi:deoxyribodipyrimidine photo-lyase